MSDQTGEDGTDNLYNIERISFADGIFTVSDHTFVFGIPSHLTHELVLPDALNTGETGVGEIIFTNNSGYEVRGAFLLEVSSDGALIQSVEGELYSENQLLLIKDHNENGIWELGESAKATFSIKNVSPLYADDPYIDVKVHDPRSEIDWSSLIETYKMDFVTDSAAEIIVSNLQSLNGDTVGGLTASLAANTQYISLLGVETDSAKTALLLELQEASDFGSITQRHLEGALGKGWSFVGDTQLGFYDDGTILLHGVSDIQRLLSLNIEDSAYYIVSTTADVAVNILGSRIAAPAVSPLFIQNADGTYSSSEIDGVIEVTASGYLLVLNDGKTVEFDSSGNLISVVDTNASLETIAEYDVNGNLIRLVGNNSKQLDIGYNSDGTVFDVIDELGGRFEFGYNGQNELVSNQTNDGNVSFDYEDPGLIQAVNSSGEVIDLAYDDLARLYEINTVNSFETYENYGYGGTLGNADAERAIEEELGILAQNIGESLDGAANVAIGLGKVIGGAGMGILGGLITHLTPDPLNVGPDLILDGYVTYREGANQLLGKSQGDPHLRTFDGLNYDFQGAGEFHLVNGDNINLQVRQQQYGNSQWASVNTAVAFEISGHAVSVYDGNTSLIYIDGNAVSLSSGEALQIGGGSAFYQYGRLTLVNEFDNGVVISSPPGFFNVYPFLSPNNVGAIEGLLGNANGDHSDDIALDDGTVIGLNVSAVEFYTTYADAWRIDQENSLFIYGEGETTETYTDRSFPYDVFSIDDVDATELANAQQIALDAGLQEGTVAFDNAVYDILITGDPAFAQYAADSLNISPAGSSNEEYVLSVDRVETFEESDFESFTSQDVIVTTLDVESHTELHLAGNTWKALDFDYQVTSDTYVTLDYKTNVQGELHGLIFLRDGLDPSNNGSEHWHSESDFIRLDGTQTYNGTDVLYTESNAEWQTITIRVADYNSIGDDIDHLVFVSDDDTNALASSSFRNIRVYEGDPTIAPSNVSALSFTDTDFLSYTAQDQVVTTFTTMNNNELHLAGNTWKALDFDYRITDHSYVTLDYKTIVQGEVQGVVFFEQGSDPSASNFQPTLEHFIRLDGTQEFNGTHNLYDDPNGDWQTITAKLSDFHSLDAVIEYIVFANDDDENALAESAFRNIRVFEDNGIYGDALDNVIQGTSGEDYLYGSEGADTFLFEAVNAFDAVDTVGDFDLTEGDAIDVSDLLSGYDPVNDAISDFIQITDNGTDSILSVDADGGADNFVQIATILNVTGLSDEASLETNGNLIAA